ncbi:MAG: type II toxin-antitoxin system PemK/MazF family toxin [Phycisphaerae bacterium]
MTPKPGEIYGAYDPSGKKRPMLIVSREDLNSGKYVVAVPLTTQDYGYRCRLPNCVPFRSGEFWLDRDCVLQAEAVTQIDKSFLDIDFGPWGILDDPRMRSVIHAIGLVISAECEPA